MSEQLHLTLPQLPDARTNMLWNGLAVRLNVTWAMHHDPAPCIRIHNSQRALVIPIAPIAPVESFGLHHLHHASAQYSLLANKPLNLRSEGSTFYMNADVITPLQRMVGLQLEDDLHPRAADGTLAGASYEKYGLSAHMLGIDYVGELAALISQLLQRSLPRAWQTIAPNAPYALITTFDCDGFLPGQPDALRRFLDEHEVIRPTLFVMAPDAADTTLYDPRYDPADPALRPLYETSEIGLHSSYLAYHDGVCMAAQKLRLEQAVGRSVHGHRSHYLRFGFPYTWGHVAKAGFSYDMTMGFYDLPGHRQGGSQPIPLADPSGRERLLWSWGVGLMDQHLFMKGSPLAWNEGAGKLALTELLGRLRKTGGTLVLDWHVHGMNPEQFPHHYTALGWLLNEARRDGAWIGGAQLLLDLYQARPSAQRLASELVIITKEQPELSDSSHDNLHAAHYVQGATGAALAGIGYVDAASHSFLATLPANATRIADIGCGNGWISQRVPPLRQVLCVDIDPAITQRISRRGIVGSLPHLPIQDAQTDLVLCTDVLEHLTTQDAIAAGKEFDRISTRYVYLQTPYRERLEDSQRQCTACNEQWHVSFHLAAHDATSLAKMMPSGWHLHSIAYTGEVRLVDSSLRNTAGELLGQHPIQHQPFTCISCGHVHEFNPGTPDPRLSEAQSKERLSLPSYSEVAVMLARADVPRMWEDSQPVVVSRNGTSALLPRPHRSNSHHIDFCAPVEEVASVASTYQIPCVVLQDAVMLPGRAGTELLTSELASSATLFMVFPDQHKAGENFVLQAEILSQKPASLTLQAFNWCNQSCGVVHATVEGIFRLELPLEQPAYCVVLYVSNGDRIRLQHASFSGASRSIYLYDIGTSFAHGHVQMHRRGVCQRWLVPAHGRLWVDRPFLEQPGEHFSPCDDLGLPNQAPHQALLLAMAAFTTADNLDSAQQALLLAMASFSVADAQTRPTTKRPLIVRWLLQHDRRIAAKLRSVIPVRYYQKLRQLYARLLRQLTKPEQR